MKPQTHFLRNPKNPVKPQLPIVPLSLLCRCSPMFPKLAGDVLVVGAFAPLLLCCYFASVFLSLLVILVDVPSLSDLLLLVDALLASVLCRRLDVSPHYPHASVDLRPHIFFLLSR